MHELAVGQRTVLAIMNNLNSEDTKNGVDRKCKDTHFSRTIFICSHLAVETPPHQ